MENTGKHIPGRRNSKSKGPEVRKGTADLSGRRQKWQVRRAGHHENSYNDNNKQQQIASCASCRPDTLSALHIY